MNDAEYDQLVTRIIALQPALRTYLCALLADYAAADDVLQQANLVMLRKARQEPIEHLKAWAYRIAFLEASNHRQKLARDRHRFDDALLERIADAAEDRLDNLDSRREALDHCLAELPEHHRRLIDDRYGLAEADAHSVAELAAALNRPVGSIKQTLYRIRLALHDCIQRYLRRDA